MTLLTPTKGSEERRDIEYQEIDKYLLDIIVTFITHYIYFSTTRLLLGSCSHLLPFQGEARDLGKQKLFPPGPFPVNVLFPFLFHDTEVHARFFTCFLLAWSWGGMWDVLLVFCGVWGRFLEAHWLIMWSFWNFVCFDDGVM